MGVVDELDDELRSILPDEWFTFAERGDWTSLREVQIAMGSQSIVRALGRRGWIAPHWDVEHGGRGLLEPDAAEAIARLDALAYASESMRLTTRLMQLASWLLLQRAVNEGELSPAQAASDKHKVKLSRQDLAAPADQFERLPEQLRELCARSMRLQSRILHLDRLLYTKADEESVPTVNFGIRGQLEQLRRAFQVQPA